MIEIELTAPDELGQLLSAAQYKELIAAEQG
jgi:hypothetical protein